MDVKRSVIFLTLVGMSSFGCATTSHKPTQAAASPEGVVLSASNAKCTAYSPDETFPRTPDDRATVEVKLTVENTSNQVVTVAPKQVRLAERVKGQPAETAPRIGRELSLVPGERTTVALNFSEGGPTNCRDPLMLLTAGAVSIDGQPLDLEPIPLVATP